MLKVANTDLVLRFLEAGRPMREVGAGESDPRHPGHLYDLHRYQDRQTRQWARDVRAGSSRGVRMTKALGHADSQGLLETGQPGCSRS